MMIHIACNIDHNYVRHCAVTLVSLFENNPKETFTVHIIARELSETDRTSGFRQMLCLRQKV